MKNIKYTFQNDHRRQKNKNVFKMFIFFPKFNKVNIFYIIMIYLTALI